MRTLALTALVLLIAVSLAQANLIVDNSFESGSATSGDGTSTNDQWYIGGSGIMGIAESPTAQEGTYSSRTTARNEDDNEFGRTWQFMDGSNIAQGVTYTLASYTQRRYGRGTFIMRVYGWTGTPVVNSYGDPTGGDSDLLLDTGHLSDDGMSNAWFQVSDTFTAAEDYDQIQVQLEVRHLRNYSPTSVSYGCWDNVTLTPEPATMVLLGMGGLTLLRRRNRK